eukprot:15279692-Alexandrium_andersonii.AAC.1
MLACVPARSLTCLHACPARLPASLSTHSLARPPALPCLAPPCPDLPCIAQPCLALPSPALR